MNTQGTKPGPSGEAAGDTPDRLLLAAEALYAEQGYDKTSVRDIAREAGANLAAVGYHFGSKENLFHSLIQRRAEAINRRRLEDLRRLVARHAPQPPPLSEVLDVFVRMMFEKCTSDPLRGYIFRRVVVRTACDADSVLRTLLMKEMAPVLREFEQVLGAILPLADTEKLRVGLLFYLGAFINMMNFWQKTLPDGEKIFTQLPSEEYLRLLVNWGTHGFAMFQEGRRP